MDQQDQHTDAPTMSRRLSDGRVSTEQALDYGLSLAQELKRRHQNGAVAGSLHPDRIALNGASASILDGSDWGVSRYSAPEQWDGKAADGRSDVFSLGAVLYELLTGHHAVEGNNPDEWKASLAEREAAPGNGVSPDAAQLLNRCLKQRPEQRWQSVSAVVIELKLLGASLRHAKAAAEWKQWLASVRDEVGQVDQRLSARLSERLSEQQSAHDAALGEIKGAISQVESKTEEHAAAFAAANQSLGALGESVAAAHQTLGSLGESVTTTTKTLGDLGDSIRDLTGKTQSQAHTIESLQSSIAQTDEVIDHVVDAFDSMHRLVVDRVEAGAAVASQRPS